MAVTPESQKALMDILKVKQPESIAAPIQPKIGTNPLTEAYYNYIEGDPLAQQVSGGDPLKKLLRFASEFVPGINTELAQRRGDKVGEALSYLDALGAASLPIKAGARLQRAKDMGFDIENPVYHGTHADNIKEFDDKFIGNRDEGFFGRGHYFTDNYGEASYYGPNVGEYYTKGKLLDLSQTKENSNFKLLDKDYFKFWTKELDKLDMLDEPTKKGLKTINKIDDYVDNNVKFIRADDNRGNEGIAAYVKNPSQYGQDKIYSNFGLADKETAIRSLKENIIDETQYKSDLRKIFPDTENILYSLSDYIRVGGKGAEELTKQAKKAGYDGIKVGDETVIFDPKNIRSVDAKFDPKKINSSNLLAGVGGLSLLAVDPQE